MNLDSLSFALSQISYSVANLTKRNYKSSVQEISHLIAQHGAEADRHLFRCLFSHVDFSGDGKSSGKDFHQTQYLIQECASLITKPNFVSTLCYAVDNPLHHQKSLKVSTHLLGQLSKVLKLTRVQEVAFAVALFKSANSETRQHAAQFLRQKLPQLIETYIDPENTSEQEGGLQDIAIEVLHLVLNELTYSQESLGLSEEQKEQFLKAIRKDFPKERAPAILAPLLHPDPEDVPTNKLNLEVVNLSPIANMDPSLADMIREVGYGFTASPEECRNNFAHIGMRDITPRSVAQVFGMMSETPAGLSDPINIQSMGGGGSGSWTDVKDKQDPANPSSWNITVFVQVLREVAPQLNWKEVVCELDYPEFRISSKAGLQVLVSAFFRGFPQPLSETFPIDLLYRPWKNTEGQLSWIVQSLKNPDVFCFSDYPCHTVVIDILKTPPDEKTEINTWKSLDLVETLLRLSEHGHYQNISELFKFPVMNCPDMLVLALLQIPTWNTLKHELLSGLMPTFLGTHPNSAMVLHYAWHCQEILAKKLNNPEDIWNQLLEINEENPWFSARNSSKSSLKQSEGQSTTIRTLVMHAMAEWYMRGEHHDQSRLSRILDVAQDLKALSMLLNATPFAFVIDLACLASRREYLKLDKWLADKIREHREPFVQACVHFLKRRCPQLMGTAGKDDQGPQNKAQQLPPDTVRAMLACLQAFVNNVAQELSEAIVTMVANASVVLQKRQGAPTPTSAIVGPPKGGLGPSLPVVANPATPPTQIDAIGLGGLGPLGPPVGAPTPPQPTSAITTSPFPASLGSLTSTPGSPAKSFPTLGQVTGTGGTSQNPAFNQMQSITSQLQSLSMSTTMSTGMPSTSLPVSRPAGAPALGGLSGTIKAQTPETLRRVPSGMESTFKPGADLSGVAGQPPSGGDVSSIFPNMNQQFSKEIEDEANSYFQRIYNHAPHPTLSIDEVLEMLKRFKDSPNKKERDVYACMLRNLFEEYRFFPQYPDRELHTTAVLFGGIIEQRLVTYMDLGIALRYVLEALKKPHGSRMYFFGIAALDRFKTRLKIYPQYCQYLEAIPHFSQFPQQLKEFIEYGARSQEPPYRPTQMPLNPGPVTPSALPTTSAPTSVAPTPVTTAPSPATSTPAPGASHGAIGGSRPHQSAPSRPSIATATNIDTLLAGTEGKEEIAVPPEQVQDKVFFIFNNLSLANMDQKAQELKENIGDEYMIWVSQYLVMKRASIEHNFHTLYANFIDHLKKGESFIQLVIKETHRNIKVLLRSDKGVANFSDRSLLKNLGHWLGLLTLARNKPILQLDIDLKSLLYEAYHKGSQELLYVVPFVAKVIESCAKSKVFKPPNPWTMAIMNVLAELHQEPELKLNLKFEIEVLCKNLNLDINDLTPGHYLADVERMNTLEFQLSDPSKKTESSSTPQPEEPLQINMPTPTTTAMQSTAVTMTTATTTTPVVVPPQPQFGYHEINVLSLSGLSAHININENLALFQQNPNMRQLVRPAIELSVQELLPPVVERSIKIALTTSEQIVKKDFALDPEESRMRAAAHHMVRFMTAGMALITCREPLVLSINNNLKKAFSSQMRGPNPQQKEMMEHAAHVLAHDNVELACSFIQKTAVEKAIPEMDKRLATEYELRKHARNEGRRYCDPVVLTYQAERMPEQIRLKVGGVTHQQFAVYEEFARNIPGFLPTAQEASQSGIASQKVRPPAQPTQVPQNTEVPNIAADEVTQIYDKIAQEIDQLTRNMIAPQGNPQVAAVRSLMETLLVARGSAFDMMSAVHLVQKAVEGLLDGLTPQPNAQELMMRCRDCHILVLKGMQDPRAYGPQWTNKMVTRQLLECRGENKYNVEAIDCLIRHHLVSMQQYDMHLAQSMENGLNYMATAFAMSILQRFFVEAKDNTIGEGDFFNTIETLARIAVHSRQAPEGLPALIESIRSNSDSGLLERAPGGPTSMMHSGISQAREFDDPPGLHDKTEYLLREWVNMYHSPAAGKDSYKAFSAFVAQMHQQGILKTDDLITRFFRLCTEMCVDLCYRALSEHNQSPTLIRAKCFHTLDAFVRLIALLVKHSGDTSNTVTKINLLNKVLGIVAGVLLQDHEVRHTEFQQLPYHRIFIMLFIEVNAPEHVLESINFQVLQAFCNTFHILRPAKAPGFAYAWLELVSHRVFIGRMLAITPQQRSVTPSGDNAHPGWGMYAQLLIDLFKFLAPFLRNAELTKPTQLLYKGTLRVLLVLLHDFPEFLSDYHYTFCDVIPPNCVQMRNLILSAFPRTMRLPDPFTPNLKVDMLPEISAAPRIMTIMTSFANMIQPASFKKDLESYLKTRSPVTFLSELRSKLQMQISSEPGMRYNLPMMNALVLYVGTQAIAYIHSKGLTPSMSTIAHSSHMDIFQNLAVDLDTEGRFLFLNAIANQLRYPNSHTHYFSCTLLYLFAEANTEAIQEQITRVLLERLIVNRPHPWGLLITFIELIKNPQFKFWNHEFVHCAPEIEKLLESVARSCMQPKQAQGIREHDTPDIH